MLAVIGLHVLACIAAAFLTPRLGPKTFLVAALAPLSGVILLVASAADVTAGDDQTQTVPWVPGLDLSLTLRLDGLAWIMLVLVSGVGLAIFTFCAWYAHRDPTLTRFVATLTAFAGAMVGVVLADDVLLLYVFWELTSITSFLLVGLKTDDPASRRAALQALLITVLGGLAMLVGLLTVAGAAGTTRIADLVADPPQATTIVQVGVGLILLGALTKSAQVPFHIWLPGAMAAPTPVSAYLHAAAMVKAGIYLIARFAPAFADLPWWRPVLVGFGMATMLVGGWRSLRQHDLKRLLAFSTVSQLGFLTIVAGWGTDTAAVALAVLLLAHGLAKAALFLGLGALDHQAGSRDLRALDGLARRMPVLAVSTGLAAASMAGVPLLVGFIAKEAVLAVLVDAFADPDLPTVAGAVAIAGIVIGSMFTVGYALRFWWGAFAAKGTVRRADDPDARPTELPAVDATTVTSPAPGMTVPVAVLAGAGLLLGVAPGLADRGVGAVAGPYRTGYQTHLALWHGFNLPLGLSALALLGGIGLFYGRRRLGMLQDRVGRALPDAVDADFGYDQLLRAVDRVSAWVTGRTQVGSLPVYLGVIASVAVLLPSTALVFGDTPLPRLAWYDSPAQLPAAVVVTAACAALWVVRSRLTAVILLGAVGYGLAWLFALQAAPDLAMTQLLVETLSVVVFLLVLRLLPARFPAARPRRGHLPGPGLRAGIALGVGLLAATLAVVTSTPDRGEPVAAEMLQRSYPQGHGRNVVNVILVDFRGLDTFGEATVVLVAALGIASLVLTARRPAGTERPAKPTRNPSLILSVSMRVLYHAILATGLFMLFAGHNSPGGGFIGGLVASAAFVLRYLTELPTRPSPIPPVPLLGVGLLLAAGTAIAPMLAGGQVLTSGYHSLALPVLGRIPLTSVLIFDAGIFAVVVGLTLVLLETLGARRSTSIGVVNEQARL